MSVKTHDRTLILHIKPETALSKKIKPSIQETQTGLATNSTMYSETFLGQIAFRRLQDCGQQVHSHEAQLNPKKLFFALTTNFGDERHGETQANDALCAV